MTGRGIYRPISIRGYLFPYLPIMKISLLTPGSVLTAYGLLTACENKNQLSRSKAERMLTEQFKFAVTDTIQIHNMHQIDEYAVGQFPSTCKSTILILL